MLRRTSHRESLPSLALALVSKDALAEVRARFVPEVRERFLQEDVRSLLEDWRLSCFLDAHNNDADVAFAVLLECLKWRAAFDVQHVSMLALKPLLDRRFMYIHGEDLAGKAILWVNLSEHEAGDRRSEELFVYWLERHTTETHAAGLTLFLDMTSTTLKHMDFDLIKFLLHALKYYYPCICKQVLVFDSPPVLNASWKVVRSWTDAGHPSIEQVSRESVRHFVHPRYLQPHQGGEDSFVFTMEELARCIPSRVLHSTASTTLDDGGDEGLPRPDLDAFPSKRSVKFRGHEEDVGRGAPLMLPPAGSVRLRSDSGTRRRGSLPPNIQPLATKRLEAPAEEWIENSFLALCPGEELNLRKVSGEADFVDVVALRNLSDDSTLTFKIKTTSPEKFRVRPCTGSIAPGATETVRVYLQSEYQDTAHREKFLLMALLSSSDSPTEKFATTWNETPTTRRVEQRLRCRVVGDGLALSNGHVLRASNADLNERVAELANAQRVLVVILVFLFVVQILSLWNHRASIHALQAALDDLTKKTSPHGDEL